MNLSSKKKKDKNAIAKFFIKHPNLRLNLDRVIDFFEKLEFAYIISMIAIIVVLAFLFYISIPSELGELKRSLSTFITGILSIVVIPIYINKINIEHKQKYQLYKTNEILYLELINVFIDILTSQNCNSEKLTEFVKSHCAEIMLQFPEDLGYNLYMSIDFLSQNKLEIAKYYMIKCMEIIRKQSGNNKLYLNYEKYLSIVKIGKQNEINNIIKNS